MTIDRQRITAVKVLEALGYRFTCSDRLAPDVGAPSLLDAEGFHVRSAGAARRQARRLRGWIG